MTTLHVEVTRYAYLKTCISRWVIHNSEGGSFTNSGEYRSLRALGKAFKSQYPSLARYGTRVVFRTIHGYSPNGAPLETVYEMDYTDMFGEG